MVTGNHIQHTGGVHSSPTGIYAYQCYNGPQISTNRLLLISGTGIYVTLSAGVSPDSILVSNNYIRIESTQNSTGIGVANTNLCNLYYNTVYISSTHTGSKCIYTYFGSGINTINNVLMNDGGGYALHHFSEAPVAISDYNDLYTPGGNTARNSSTIYPTIADWQATGKDSNSLSEDPLFADPNDVHITSAMLNAAGTPLGAITEDIEGDLRDPVSPDIGADEFSLATDDVGMVAINYPAEPFPSGMNTVFIKFVNNGDDTLTSMQVDFEIDSITQPTYFWTGLLGSGETYDSLDIGDFDFAPSQSHDIKVWVSNPNEMTDGLASNDTLEVTNLYPALLGTYTIGGLDPDFATISLAIAALDSGGAAGPVTFNIRDGVYLDTLVINEFPGSACGTPVVFQSESLDSSAVVISNLGLNNYPLTINGADGLVFQHLTIETVNPSYRRAVYYHSGADCNSFFNNVLRGYYVTSYASSWSVVYGAPGADSANVFENNFVELGAIGFYLRGDDDHLSGTVIRNNTISQNHGYGIYALEEDGIEVSGNVIFNSVHPSFYAIRLSSCDSALTVTNNSISSLEGNYGIYLGSCSTTPGEVTLIANNMVAVGGPDRSHPLYLSSCDNVDVVHNSLHAHSTTSSTSYNTAFYYNNCTNIQLYNSIMANSSTNGYAMTGSASGLTDAEDNCYFSTSVTNFIDANGFIESNLADWQSSSSLDASSIESDPAYTSDTDLHATLILLNGAATPYPGIADDIDGEVRDITNPDIGADEFTPALSNDAGIMGLAGPVVPFASGLQDVKAVLKNFGGLTLDSANIRWIVNGFEQVQYQWTGSLSPGACDTVTLGSFSFSPALPHDLQFWTESPNGVPDSTQANDTLIIDDLYPALVGTYTVGGVLPDFNLFLQIEDALTRGGILGDVVFEIRDGIYNEQFTIAEFPRVDPLHEVIFQSESGDSSSVTIQRNFSSSDNFTVQLDEAYKVGFKQLTFKSSQGRVFDIRNGSSDIEIENCVITGKEFPGNSANHTCIWSPSTAEKNIRIANCEIQFGSYGILMEGTSGAMEKGLEIEDNVLLNQDWRILFFKYSHNPAVVGNTIASSESPLALYMFNADSALNISQNHITLPDGGIGISLHNSTYPPGQDARVYNNYIEIGGTSQSYGINLEYSSRVNLEYNTIRLDNTRQASQHWLQSAGVRFFSGTGNVMNNNNIACLGGALCYDGYSVTGDNNNLYTTGSTLAYHVYSHPDILDLASATGTNLNSVSVDPLFSTPGLPDVQQTGIDGKAATLSGIGTDIYGTPRHVSTPDIGAVEFTPLANDLGLTVLVSPETYCGLSSTELVTVRIQNFGSSSQSGCDVAYSINGSGWTEENIGAVTIPAGEFYDYTFTTFEDLSTPGEYEISSYVSHAGDENLSNDTLWDQTVTHYPALTTAPANLIPEDGAINEDKPISISWSPAPDASAYDVYIWPYGDAEPASPQLTNLTQINALYNSVAYATTYNWRVVAKNICEDTVQSATQIFTTRLLPDLVVDTVIAPPTAFSGEQIQVEWYVRNQGLGSTQSTLWSDAVYLSTDATLNTSYDTYLGAIQNLTALDSNQSYSNLQPFTIPEGLIGTYYIIVQSDRWNSIIESENGNNWERTVSTTEISLTPPPDLIVAAVVAPSSAFSDQDITIDFTIENNGTGAALPDPTWTDKVFIQSLDESFYADLTFAHRSLSLQPDSTYSFNTIVTMPQGINGEFVIGVEADYLDWLFEFGAEGNNIGFSDTIDIFLTPPPDLVPLAISLPDTVSPNQTLPINVNVVNQGAGGVPETNEWWYNRVSISQSPIFNSAFNNPIGHQSGYYLQFDQASDTFNYAISSKIPPSYSGHYYLYGEIDYSDRVYEYLSDDNNIVRSDSTVFVALPDLEPVGITHPLIVNSGEEVTVDWYLFNSGIGHLISRYSTYKMYLSDDTTLDAGDVLLKSKNTFSTLEPGDSSALIRNDIEIPASASGTKYIIVHVDSGDQINELPSEANNVLAGPAMTAQLAPWPDLTAMSLITPDTSIGNAPIQVEFDIKNIGTGPIDNPWDDGVYISFSPTWEPEFATELLVYTNSLTLNPNDSVHRTFNILPPEDISSNYYYIYVVLDEEEEVFENGQNGNNIVRSDSIFIMDQPETDLLNDTVFTNIDTTSSGTLFFIDWVTTNNGNGLPAVGNWTDAIYLSTDANLDPNLDILLSNIQVSSPTLEPDSSLSRTVGVSTPNGLSGDYYLIVDVDHNDAQMDVERLNNANIVRDETGTPRTIHCLLSPSPDLQVAQFMAPSIGTAGQPLDIDLSITNAGDAAASNWYDRVYLSTDETIDAGDILLFYRDSATLEPGATDTITRQVYIPASVSGNRILIVETDADDHLYEHLGEHNNVQLRSIEVEVPLPSDLVAENITVPSDVIAGEFATISWETANNGSNVAQGQMREVVYLSTDTLLDLSDEIFTVQDKTIFIAPGGSEAFNHAGRVLNSKIGDYYALVQTDAYQNIIESDDNNNISSSNTTMSVDVPELILDSLYTRNAINGREIYYKVTIPAYFEGSNLLVEVWGDTLESHNEIYARFDQMPTRAEYDARFQNAANSYQRLVLPDVQAGTYYIMVLCEQFTESDQDIDLHATLLSYSLLAATPDKGSNEGFVTMTLIGTDLDSTESVRLTDSLENNFYADTFVIVNDGEIIARFDLRGMEPGLYNIETFCCVDYLGRLEGAFTVLEEGEADLQISYRYAPAVFFNTAPYTKLIVEAINNGVVDVENASFKIASVFGTQLAADLDQFQADELVQEFTLPISSTDAFSNILAPGEAVRYELLLRPEPYPLISLQIVND